MGMVRSQGFAWLYLEEQGVLGMGWACFGPTRSLWCGPYLDPETPSNLSFCAHPLFNLNSKFDHLHSAQGRTKIAPSVPKPITKCGHRTSAMVEVQKSHQHSLWFHLNICTTLHLSLSLSIHKICVQVYFFFFFYMLCYMLTCQICFLFC